MSGMDARQRQLVKVSQLYYQDDLTQGEIAARLHLSRSKVVRLLQEARQVGIVQIRIIAPSNTSVALERRLECRFNLQQAVVVESDSMRRDEIRAAVGNEGARLLANVLKPGTVLALSSGTTLAAVVDAMAPMHDADVSIVELQGMVSDGGTPGEYDTEHLATHLAETIQAQYRLLPVPREMGTPEAVTAILSDPRIQRTLALARRAHVLLVGMGSIDPLSPTLSHLADDVLTALKGEGAVGEIATRFFDAVGTPCHSALDARLIGLELTEMRTIPVRIGAAFGLPKVPAIVGALRGGYVNMLVTDAPTAEAVLAHAPPGEAMGKEREEREERSGHAVP